MRRSRSRPPGISFTGCCREGRVRVTPEGCPTAGLYLFTAAALEKALTGCFALRTADRDGLRPNQKNHVNN